MKKKIKMLLKKKDFFFCENIPPQVIISTKLLLTNQLQQSLFLERGGDCYVDPNFLKILGWMGLFVFVKILRVLHDVLTNVKTNDNHVLEQ